MPITGGGGPGCARSPPPGRKKIAPLAALGKTGRARRRASRAAGTPVAFSVAFGRLLGLRDENLSRRANEAVVSQRSAMKASAVSPSVTITCAGAR